MRYILVSSDQRDGAWLDQASKVKHPEGRISKTVAKKIVSEIPLNSKRIALKK